jgi:aminoglycoside phosphotransferase (APT) family kinase protein
VDEMSSHDSPVSTSGDVPGVDVDAVTRWMEAHIDGAKGPFRFDVIAGGHSNLTYRVTGSTGTRYVLRRPPLGHRDIAGGVGESPELVVGDLRAVHPKAVHTHTMGGA